jgi:hypothetical protein
MVTSLCVIFSSHIWVIIEIAKKRMQERQNIINARSGDSTLFYKLIKQQRGKLSRFIEELQVDDQRSSIVVFFLLIV